MVKKNRRGDTMMQKLGFYGCIVKKGKRTKGKRVRKKGGTAIGKQTMSERG